MRSLVVSTILLAACGAAAHPHSPASLDARRQQLRELFAETWEYGLRTAPEFASTLGDKRFNDRWSDVSDAATRKDYEAQHAFAKRLAAIDTADFPEQERLSAELLAFTYKQSFAGERFEAWLMPVNQMGGPQSDLAALVPSLPFDTVKDYDDYIARLRSIPTVFDQTTATMKLGLGKHLIPPKVLLAAVADQAQAIATAAPEQSPFALPLTKFPAAIAEADRARIRTEILAAIHDRVDPAFAAFATYVRTDYAPHGRDEVGEWSLPDGEARYAHDLEVYTTTPLTADQVHETGLREVARIEKLMLATAQKLGYADLHAMSAALAKDPAHHFHSREEVLASYRGFIAGIYPHLPELFGRLPKGTLEVVPVEEFREASQAGAFYEQGSPDGARPGRVHVNTGAFETRSPLNVETTAYHEGIPGHHMQMTIEMEMPDLPLFRQHYFTSAFGEGWALYSERLAEDLGLYKDPYSYYGHLQDEMLRAIRLVVDTGLHAKHWSRQQVVDFFHAHSTSDEVEVQSETDRYIGWPGQAVSYKIGQLKLLELRDRAKRELGPDFDIRGFHDTVLDAGALPLEMLETRVVEWIATVQSARRKQTTSAPQ